MLQIGEFSRVCQVSVKTLHHYDKIGLLIPAEVDRFTGYRYYKTEQIDDMNYIQRLKRYGFSLDEIQHLLPISDKKELVNALRQQMEQLKRKKQEMDIILNELQTHISVLDVYKRQAMIFSDLISNLERVADHGTNIAFAEQDEEEL